MMLLQTFPHLNLNVNSTFTSSADVQQWLMHIHSFDRTASSLYYHHPLRCKNQPPWWILHQGEQHQSCIFCQKTCFTSIHSSCKQVNKEIIKPLPSPLGWHQPDMQYRSAAFPKTSCSCWPHDLQWSVGVSGDDNMTVEMMKSMMNWTTKYLLITKRTPSLCTLERTKEHVFIHEQKSYTSIPLVIKHLLNILCD